MKLKNKTYDVLKWISTIFIPALVTFIGVVFGVCGIDAQITTIVVTILGAVGTLIGTLIGISSSNYKNETKEV